MTKKKVSTRTWLLIGLWAAVTFIVAVLTHGEENTTNTLAIASAPLLLIALISLIFDLK